MRVGDEVGGHFVSGHVDAVCKVAAIDAEGGGHRVRFDLPTVCAAHVCYKGSVCVNGVSLTVNRADAESFEVNLIPYTLEHTNLGDLAVGQSVNLEVDLLSRYLHRLMSRAGAA